MTGLVEGKVALVTGASGGIGKAIAALLVKEGARVLIVDRAAEEIGSNAAFFEGDVTSAESMKAAVEEAVSRWGSLDIAYNNAGVDLLGPKLHEIEQPQWDRIIAVNLTGVFTCMQAQLAQMLPQGQGSIINTASISGEVGAVGLSAYVASKHGVVGLSKSAALDYANDGIRINVISPGFVLTPMAEASLTPAQITASSAQIPAKRMATPNEIAEAAVWLGSDRASYATGSVVTVDGGFTAQ